MQLFCDLQAFSQAMVRTCVSACQLVTVTASLLLTHPHTAAALLLWSMPSCCGLQACKPWCLPHVWSACSVIIEARCCDGSPAAHKSLHFDCFGALIHAIMLWPASMQAKMPLTWPASDCEHSSQNLHYVKCCLLMLEPQPLCYCWQCMYSEHIAQACVNRGEAICWANSVTWYPTSSKHWILVNHVILLCHAKQSFRAVCWALNAVCPASGHSPLLTCNWVGRSANKYVLWRTGWSFRAVCWAFNIVWHASSHSQLLPGDWVGRWDLAGHRLWQTSQQTCKLSGIKSYIEPIWPVTHR